jgi:hypothetical protein
MSRIMSRFSGSQGSPCLPARPFAPPSDDAVPSSSPGTGDSHRGGLCRSDRLGLWLARTGSRGRSSVASPVEAALHPPALGQRVRARRAAQGLLRPVVHLGLPAGGRLRHRPGHLASSHACRTLVLTPPRQEGLVAVAAAPARAFDAAALAVVVVPVPAGRADGSECVVFPDSLTLRRRSGEGSLGGEVSHRPTRITVG